MYEFVFKYRYHILAVLIIGIILMGFYLNYRLNIPVDKVAPIVTGGFVIITLFFSALTYEYNSSKTQRETEYARRILTYNTAVEWHKPPIVTYMSTITKYALDIEKFTNKKDIDGFWNYLLLPENLEVRAAISSIFNYFESISLGIEKKLIDEEFVRQFFDSLFSDFYKEYGFYIDFRREKIDKDQEAWRRFTNFAVKWDKERAVEDQRLSNS